jgi:hypothetical protein
MRITKSILSYHKKSSLDVHLVEDIKDIRCSLWDRTIVKGEIYHLSAMVHPP